MQQYQLLVFLALSSVASALVAKDKVSYKDLGVTNWTPGFDTYSGYVTVKDLPITVNVTAEDNATAVDHHVHYM